MLDKLKDLQEKFERLTSSLSDPEILADRETFKANSQERAELQPIVECFQRWQIAKEELQSSEEILSISTDSEMKELAKEEVDSLKKLIADLHSELMILLLPKDPNEDKNIIIEIRAGTGGDESALFASELFNMYCRYADQKRWKAELLSFSESSVGGYKEVIFQIIGNGAFSCFKYESGVHRVQRVPQTETQGRVHTSTVTVAVLPEAEEVDVQVEDKDLRIDVYRASGPGGQSVNTTDSAVRITHIPTGLVATCQDEKSQHKNRAKALTILRARILDRKQREEDAKRRDNRRSQIGSGERSEKIRTYNFPQVRVTDHRIGFTMHQIDTLLGGDLDIMIEPLRAHYRTEALKDSEID